MAIVLLKKFIKISIYNVIIAMNFSNNIIENEIKNTTKNETNVR